LWPKYKENRGCMACASALGLFMELKGMLQLIIFVGVE